MPPQNQAPEGGLRNPIEMPLPQNIEVARTRLDGLSRAWNVFQGNEKMSQELKKLTEQYLSQHPEALDQGARKVRHENLQSLRKELHSRTRTFELVATHNHTIGLLDLQRRRQEAGTNATQVQLDQMAQAEQYELLWSIIPRLTRRSLRTFDRYGVLVQQYVHNPSTRYPGLTVNEGLTKLATAQLNELSTAMENRVKAGEEQNDIAIRNADERIRQVLISLPLTANNLYVDFLERAFLRNAAIRREGSRGGHTPAYLERLEAEHTLIAFEASSFRLNAGAQSIEDVAILTIPNARRNFEQLSKQEQERAKKELEGQHWQLSREDGELVVNSTIQNISSNLRAHCNAVLGVPEPGQAAPSERGLFDRTLGITMEELLTGNRDAMFRMFRMLMLYRGGMRWAVGEGVRLPATIFGLRGVVDGVLGEVETPAQYARKHQAEVLRGMGLPPDFDFTPEAWARLEANPAQMKEFEARRKTLAEILRKAEPEIRTALEGIKQDLVILEILSKKRRREIMVNAQIDEAWIKNHRTITAADIQAIPDNDGGKIIAAHIVLLEQMNTHWTQYARGMEACSDAVLGNIRGHIAIEEGIKKVEDATSGEDRTFLWYLVMAGLIALGAGATAASYSVLARLGRYGGWSGTRGPVGLFGRMPGVNATLVRYSPTSVVNAVTRPLGLGYVSEWVRDGFRDPNLHSVLRNPNLFSTHAETRIKAMADLSRWEREFVNQLDRLIRDAGIRERGLQCLLDASNRSPEHARALQRAFVRLHPLEMARVVRVLGDAQGNAEIFIRQLIQSSPEELTSSLLKIAQESSQGIDISRIRSAVIPGNRVQPVASEAEPNLHPASETTARYWENKFTQEGRTAAQRTLRQMELELRAAGGSNVRLSGARRTAFLSLVEHALPSSINAQAGAQILKIMREVNPFRLGNFLESVHHALTIRAKVELLNSFFDTQLPAALRPNRGALTELLIRSGICGDPSTVLNILERNVATEIRMPARWQGRIARFGGNVAGVLVVDELVNRALGGEGRITELVRDGQEWVEALSYRDRLMKEIREKMEQSGNFNRESEHIYVNRGTGRRVDLRNIANATPDRSLLVAARICTTLGTTALEALALCTGVVPGMIAIETGRLFMRQPFIQMLVAEFNAPRAEEYARFLQELPFEIAVLLSPRAMLGESPELTWNRFHNLSFRAGNPRLINGRWNLAMDQQRDSARYRLAQILASPFIMANPQARRYLEINANIGGFDPRNLLNRNFNSEAELMRAIDREVRRSVVTSIVRNYANARSRIERFERMQKSAGPNEAIYDPEIQNMRRLADELGDEVVFGMTVRELYDTRLRGLSDSSTAIEVMVSEETVNEHYVLPHPQAAEVALEGVNALTRLGAREEEFNGTVYLRLGDARYLFSRGRWHIRMAQEGSRMQAVSLGVPAEDVQTRRAVQLLTTLELSLEDQPDLVIQETRQRKLETERRGRAFFSGLLNPERARKEFEVRSKDLQRRREEMTRVPENFTPDMAPSFQFDGQEFSSRIAFRQERGEIYELCWRENYRPEDAIEIRYMDGWQVRVMGSDHQSSRLWTAVTPSISVLTPIGTTERQAGIRACNEFLQRLARVNEV